MRSSLTRKLNPIFSFLVKLDFCLAKLTMESPTLSLRINRDNPNHHIWSNNGTWWLLLTMHLPDYTKLRLRRSLKTDNIKVARRKRDQILQEGAALPFQ
jgi:hypothetical protein